MLKRYAESQVKTIEVDIEQGEPVIKETWIFEYPDGETDYLQRRHPITDPVARESILEQAVETVLVPVHGVTIRGLITVDSQLPGVVEPKHIKVEMR